MTDKNKNNKQVKNLHLELKAIGDDGTLTGYGNVFNVVDSYGDKVLPGAFAKTLADRAGKIRLLWQHDSTQPIGVWDSMEEDSVGLKVQGRLALNTQQGKEAYALLKMGALDGLSIGYSVVQAETEPKTGVNLLKELKLYETSLVTFPANESSTVTSIKSAFEELDEEQRVKTLTFINNLKQTPLQGAAEPPITEASVEKHSEELEAGRAETEEPQAESLHLMEQLLESLKQLKEGNQ